MNFFAIFILQDRFITAPKGTVIVNRASVLAFAVLGILLVGSTSQAFAAQLNWDAKTFETAQNPKFTFQRSAFIEYKDGGAIADALRGKELTMNFVADSSSPGMQDLIDKINDDLASKRSSAHVTDVRLEYNAHMVGRGDNVSVDFRIILIPTINGFLIREYREGSPALFDVTWRGLVVNGQVPVTTQKYGVVDVNQPLSFFKINFPEVAAQIQGTEAQKILEMPLIDSSGIGNQPLTNWHFLFDPTGIAAETSRYGFSGAKVVVSSFTMGESSFREGQVREKEFKATFSSDRTYHVRTVQSGDSANIFLAGYASPDMLEGHEVVGVSATAPTTAAQTSTGSFPVFIIYGMAGMAAAGAGGFFYWSNKKAKQESEYVQRGIDPKYLRATSTSEASGGYHTTRGEAELIGDDQSYKQHQSVYEQQGSLPAGYEKPKDEPKPSSTRGSMPKDWKPS
ncbi:MAG: hypothetical protein QXW37_03775 [Candidatus Nitrosotenuis sp.]